MPYIKAIVMFFMLFAQFPLSYGNDALEVCTDNIERQLLYKGEDVKEARVKAARICNLQMKSDKDYRFKKMLEQSKKTEIDNAETYLCEFSSGAKKAFRRVVDEHMYDFAERDISNFYNEGLLILEENDKHLSLYDKSSSALSENDEEASSYIAEFFYINKVSKKVKWTTLDFFDPNYFFEDDGDCLVYKNKEIEGKFEELGFGDYH